MESAYVFCENFVIFDPTKTCTNVCCSFSPPAAEYGLVVNYQFWQPTFPCWLMAFWERVDCSLFVASPLEEDCLTVLKGSSTRAGTGCNDLQLIVSSQQCGRLPSTDLNLHKSLLQSGTVYFLTKIMLKSTLFVAKLTRLSTFRKSGKVKSMGNCAWQNLSWCAFPFSNEIKYM